MFRAIFAWVNKYERHLSAAAMVGGFIADTLLFGRVDDLWNTQIVFLAYTATCLVSIPLLHYIETRAERLGAPRPRWRGLLPIATQFALGGFWSGLLIFYGKSAVVSASWPFLLVIVGIFFGNEILRKYHERLVFTSVLFFFALYSYVIFAVPIYTGTIGRWTFLASTAMAVIIFGLFTALLRTLGRGRFFADIFAVRVGAAGVLALVVFFYFANILPPLPLAAKAAGVYHTVAHVPGVYTATTEPQSWRVRYLGSATRLRVVSGDTLYAYSSIFAPTDIHTTIVHRWQWYDGAVGEWTTRFALSYPIQGGRDGGYRGYSAIIPRLAGRWRVSVETGDGRVIARLPFNVEFVETAPAVEKIVLP